MTGRHDVRLFAFAKGVSTLSLPEGWKPFSTTIIDGNTYIVCRKWVRS
jgi:hypothetical protein